MNTTYDDFFIFPHTVNGITDADYYKLGLLIDVTDAFARNLYNGIYIVDFFKKGLLYVSPNISSWCGLSSSEIMELGLETYARVVPPAELQLIEKVGRSGAQLFGQLAIEERARCRMSCDFHIIQGKRQNLIHHTITPIALDRSGLPWLMLCTIALSARHEVGNFVLRLANSSVYYGYSIQEHKWIRKEITSLSEMERSVLALSTQGYTVTDIASALCRSVDTVKACKRAMFAKLGVKGSVEAISIAINHRLMQL